MDKFAWVCPMPAPSCSAVCQISSLLWARGGGELLLLQIQGLVARAWFKRTYTGVGREARRRYQVDCSGTQSRCALCAVRSEL